jgi:hypothetical protein
VPFQCNSDVWSTPGGAGDKVIAFRGIGPLPQFVFIWTDRVQVLLPVLIIFKPVIYTMQFSLKIMRAILPDIFAISRRLVNLKEAGESLFLKLAKTTSRVLFNLLLLQIRASRKLLVTGNFTLKDNNKNSVSGSVRQLHSSKRRSCAPSSKRLF